MVISQTPLRVSLLGGGTDFRDFYSQHGGAVLTMAIDKYIYVIVKDRFDDAIYVNYSKKEIVTRPADLQHELVREAMRRTGVTNGVEITTLADIPSEGSGLGSSSAVTVGLLNALYAHQNIQVPAAQLAREACEIEIELLGKPIGIQDQTIAAHGNLCFVEFQKSGQVAVEKLPVSPELKRDLASNILLFFTNRTRSANIILKEQRSNIADRTEELITLRNLAYRAKDAVLAGNIDEIGLLLDENWQLKKCLASGVSDDEIDSMYSAAIGAGAIGGKVAGAGGGGFLMVYCPKAKQDAVRNALRSYREMPISISRDGAKIAFNINT
jgi:D-glycero-alpha-D-manno-heptose-7-phosphate kinase